MSKAVRRMPPVGGLSGVETFELQNFARKLHQLRTDRGMSQSDLAREIWGTKTDAKGYTVAKNRARISAYEKGEHYPDPVNMKRLCEVLGVPPEELAPDLMAATVDREEPEIQLTAIAGHPDKVYFRVNTLLSLGLAAEITAMISRERRTLA